MSKPYHNNHPIRFAVTQNKPQTQKQPILALFCRPTKHPVSIALSNRILQKIGQEATRQRRSRSGFSYRIKLRLRASFSFLRLAISCVSDVIFWQVWHVWVIWQVGVGGCASLWVESDDSDAFSYPVFGDDDSGAV